MYRFVLVAASAWSAYLCQVSTSVESGTAFVWRQQAKAGNSVCSQVSGVLQRGTPYLEESEGGVAESGLVEESWVGGCSVLPPQQGGHQATGQTRQAGPAVQASPVKHDNSSNFCRTVFAKMTDQSSLLQQAAGKTVLHTEEFL